MSEFSVEITSAVAAIVSAVGGAFADIGAMRSASSARHAQEATERSEKRVALRELVVSENELSVELERVLSRAKELKASYRLLFNFSVSSNNSNEKLVVSAIEEKVLSVQKAAEEVAQHSTDLTTLYDASLDDINKRQAQIQQALFSVRSVREDIDREHSSVEAECAAYRERVLQR